MFLTKVRTALVVVLAVLAGGLITAAAYRLGAAEIAGQGAKKETPGPAAQAEDKEAPLRKALAEAARKVYDLDMARLKGRVNVSPEGLHRWSRRWLEAQLDMAKNQDERATALRDHLNRMQELERLTKALARTGQGREADAAAGTFYRTQAELWLVRGRVK